MVRPLISHLHILSLTEKRFEAVVGHQRAIPVLLQRVDVQGQKERDTHKALQTEVLIQREQLLFQLGETW